MTVTAVATMTHVCCLATGRTLRFTAAECAAFLAGARDGEFEFPDLPR